MQSMQTKTEMSDSEIYKLSKDTSIEASSENYIVKSCAIWRVTHSRDQLLLA